MFTAPVLTALVALAAPLLARAEVTPSEPAPGSIFNAGANCHISWDGDSNSTTEWKGMAIELMTGDNFNMVHLTTVAQNQDGTTSGTFDYTCPEVTINSAIYFYQFTAPLAKDTTWTGRFAIASSSGATTAPPNPTQPNGDAKPWGTGALVDPSKAVPAPSFSTTGTGNTTGNTTASVTSSTGSSTSTPLPTLTKSQTSSATSSSTGSSTANTTAPTSSAASGAFGMEPSSARVWLGAAALIAAAAAW